MSEILCKLFQFKIQLIYQSSVFEFILASYIVSNAYHLAEIHSATTPFSHLACLSTPCSSWIIPNPCCLPWYHSPTYLEPSASIQTHNYATQTCLALASYPTNTILCIFVHQAI